MKPYNRNSTHVECEDTSDTSINSRNWKNLIIIQTVPEQHAGKARNQLNT
jgi:hypothetical protein